MICIDQQTNYEKASQIRMTVNIFQNASKVLAWLASGDEEKGQACLHESRCLDLFEKSQHIVYSWQQRSGVLSEVQTRAALSMTGLPWFSSLWVVQEVMFNLNVILIYGSSESSWARFIAALPTFNKLSDAFVRATAALLHSYTIRYLAPQFSLPQEE